MPTGPNWQEYQDLLARVGALETRAAADESRLAALETWQASAVAELADHEGRIAALESPTPPPSGPSLLQPADLTYLGAFRLPAPDAQTYFGFVVGSIAFDPADGGIFLACRASAGGPLRVCKVNVPALVTGGTVSALNRAALLVPGKDPFGGLINDSLGGLHVHGGRLLWTTYVYYDASTSMTASHGWSPPDLSAANGLFKVSSLYPGKVAGVMCDVPAGYQSAYGGPCLTGRGGGNIISNSNDGPAAVGFDPAQLGVTNPVPGTARLAYDTGQLDAQSGTDGAGPGLTWAWANLLRGTFFHASAARKALGFVVRRGKGVYWYGEPADGGTCDQADPGPSCYAGAVTDRVNGGKGTHAPPYHAALYLYDPDAVASAASPSAPRPYAVADLPHPFVSAPDPANVGDQLNPLGATYDPATGRLFVTLDAADAYGLDPVPVVLVYQLP